MLMGIHTNGIGDTLLRHWGLTLTPLGIHFFAIGDSLLRHWGLTSSPLGIDCNKKGDL